MKKEKMGNKEILIIHPREKISEVALQVIREHQKANELIPLNQVRPGWNRRFEKITIRKRFSKIIFADFEEKDILRLVMPYQKILKGAYYGSYVVLNGKLFEIQGLSEDGLKPKEIKKGERK